MPYDFSPGHTDFNGTNMLPDLPTQIKQGDAQNTARLKAGNDSFKAQMQKQYGAMQGSQPALDAMGGAADQATAVAKENFNAKMAEAQTRATLHSSYMDLMWKQFQMNKKADRWGTAGAALGAAGMIGSSLFGGPVKHPEAGGGADKLTQLTSGVGGAAGDE